MSDELKQKTQEYTDYIMTHRNRALQVWAAVRPTVLHIIKDNEKLTEIDKLLVQHDASKVSEIEFIPYRIKFFPTKDDALQSSKDPKIQTWVENQFSMAFLHHTHVNPHHWQHWVQIRVQHGQPILTPLLIPFEYLIEMLCDWTAMAVGQDSTPSKWWKKNRKNTRIHRDTVSELERWLPLFDEIVADIREDKVPEWKEVLDDSEVPPSP